MNRYIPSPKKLGRWLLLPLILHLLLTTIVVLAGTSKLYPQSFDSSGVAIAYASDGTEYHKEVVQLVERLKNEGIFSWAHTAAPLHVKIYSLSYALLSPLFGYTVLSAEPLNALYYLAIVLLVFKLGQTAFSQKVGIVSACMIMLWPSFALHTTQLLRDSLFIVMMLVLVLIVLGWLIRDYSPRESVLMIMAGSAAAILLWMIRDSMWAIVLLVILLGTALLVVRQIYEKRFLLTNTAGASSVLIISLSIPCLIASYRSPESLALQNQVIPSTANISSTSPATRNSSLLGNYLCESVVEKTDKAGELVRFSCDGKPTDSNLPVCLPRLRYFGHDLLSTLEQ